MDFRYARPLPPAHPSLDPYQPLPQQPVPPPPGTGYSGQFQYRSPSPPPPQWPPQPPHSDHHHLPPPPPYAAAPPPMPYPSNHYSVPPRPHMPPPPPPQQAHYPPVNQEWSNQGWGHQGWDYSAHNKNEDDWAARAKAWAASKAVTDDQRQHSQSAPANLPEETNYQNQYSQNMDFQQHSLPPSSYQQYPSSFALPPRPPANHLQEPPSSYSSGYALDGHFSYPARDGNLRDSAAVCTHQEATPTTLSVHQQEVPSSYSSVAGKEELSDMNRNFYQPSHMAFASAPQHQVQPSVSPNERSISVEQPHYSFNNSSAEPATDLSNQPLDFGSRYGHDHGSFVQSGVPGMPYLSMPPVHTTIHQTDPSVGVSSPASLNPTPFGRISSFQPNMPPANTTFPLGTSNAFHGDTYGTPGFADRPKKASVPNWLREEIIKKKAVIGSSAPEVSRQDTESNEDEVMDQKGDRVGGKSMDSAQSAEECDDEDYVEAARTAAVNQEIKRILTEVLLKVTDELFDEIATNVLEEDDLNVEVERKADNASAATTPKSTAKVIIPANTKGADVDDASGKSSFSSPGDVLGLGNYASDDDDEEKEVKNTSVPSSNSSKLPVHLSENGSSQVDDGDVCGTKFLEESDSHRVSPNGTIESHNDKSDVEKVMPDSSDLLKPMQSVIEGDLKAKNSLQDDSQSRSHRNGPDKSSKDKKHNKVDENSRTHDERHVKRAKQEDQNGSKEKVKDQDSGKKVSKAEVKDDKEERERDKRSCDKEDNRKREKEKDEKNERTKYKSVGDSSRRRRHHSPSPGGRGRSSKDNSSVSHAHGSSDSSSDDSRRKVRSKRRDLSPSPVRSRRQLSRSPSKRSHRRHSIYSSLETTRERERRRRSRSRSRSRSRRG